MSTEPQTETTETDHQETQTVSTSTTTTDPTTRDLTELTTAYLDHLLPGVQVQVLAVGQLPEPIADFPTIRAQVLPQRDTSGLRFAPKATHSGPGAVSGKVQLAIYEHADAEPVIPTPSIPWESAAGSISQGSLTVGDQIDLGGVRVSSLTLSVKDGAAAVPTLERLELGKAGIGGHMRTEPTEQIDPSNPFSTDAVRKVPGWGLAGELEVSETVANGTRTATVAGKVESSDGSPAPYATAAAKLALLQHQHLPGLGRVTSTHLDRTGGSFRVVAVSRVS